MQMNVYGCIVVKNELSESEMAALEKEFQEEIACQSMGVSEFAIDLFDCHDVTEEISNWLKEHHNDIEEGCTVNYYGDYDGAFRYQDGEWYGADSVPIFDIPDADLIKELSYRGYNVEKFI